MFVWSRCRTPETDDALLDVVEELWASGRTISLGDRTTSHQKQQLDIPDSLSNRSITALWVRTHLADETNALNSHLL